MKLILLIVVIFIETLVHQVSSQQTIYSCGGVVIEASTISYKLNEEIAHEERCVWTVRIRNAVSYSLNVHRVGSWSGREVTGACISIESDGTTGVHQYGVLDDKGTTQLRTPCHVLIITLYFMGGPQIGKGFSMTITPTFDSYKVSHDSQHYVINTNEGAFAHPPAGTATYSDNELSTFIFVPPGNLHDPNKITSLTFIKNSLEGESCFDHLLVFKLRYREGRDNAWSSKQLKDVDKICGDTPYITWAHDDLIMVIFRSDGSVNNAGFTLLYADLPFRV
ncbi:unnamed protein product [Orchesella dallaii]|uniref:CUB domain-containing protein n=1 Tax=Orchesella dallaii TaxID=48710 RepID=A0ABP1S8K3_9HEXA